MKLQGVLLGVFVSVAAHGATSKILFSQGGGTIAGAPGNVVFNGQHFVTPTVQTNGRIGLTFLDTNAVTVSNLSLSITGSTPRLVWNAPDYLLAWLNTNDTPNALSASRISAGVLGPVSLLATNVGEETLSLSSAAGTVMAVWQSSGSNSSVFARVLQVSGAPGADAFLISPSALPQRYPSIDNDGTSFLVCWMEQNVASNDWRVLAQRVTGGALNGTPAQVSQTNSMRPYATAVSFGTNFLVAWSADEGPWHIPEWLCCFGGVTELWRPAVHARMLSETSVPLRNEFSMLRNNHYNTNVTVAFGDGRYLVTCFNRGGWDQYAQPLDADGGRREFQFGVGGFGIGPELRPRTTFAAGRFCVVWNAGVEPAGAVVVAPRSMADLRLTGLKRTNNTISLNTSLSSAIEVSTNLVDWELRSTADLPSLGGRRQLFVREGAYHWECINNLRRVDWAKHHWAFNGVKSSSSVPNMSDIYSPEFPFRICPLGGVYSLQSADVKPTCTLVGHTL